ncbi:MAG: 7-carboxy-7-deazaguanine synthase QueE [Bacteroidota bacterium]
MEKTNADNYEQMQQGLMLPVMEEFCTVQGEGHNTGKAAWFIRIGGCDVGCSWCDVKESWNAELHPLSFTKDIIEHAVQQAVRSVVITGGEPMLYNLNPLCEGLKFSGFETFLETSGSAPLSGIWDWVCLSPKKNAPALEKYYNIANELKVIIADKSDLEWAEICAEQVRNSYCILYLQPEWSRFREISPVIIDYVKNSPKWNVSVQAHKFLRIP